MRSLLLLLLAFLATAPLPAQAIGIAVERRFAAVAGLAVGDTVELASDRGAARVAVVEAIYAERDDPATLMRRDHRVRLHLADLADLLGAPDRVDRIGLALAGDVTDSTALERLAPVAFGYALLPTTEVADVSSSTFAVVSRFHRAITVISVLASAIFLLCLMLLKVEERRADVATLRLIGISRRTIIASLVLEATGLALAGSACGALLAVVASAVVNVAYRQLFATGLRFSQLEPLTMALALALSMVLGVCAGLVAAARLSRTSPMRLWGRRS